MTRLGTLMIAAALVALVAACGSSPPVRYYGLEPAQSAAETSGDASVVVGLGPFRIPEHLKRPQIVTRSGAERVVDDFARWAEPLDMAIHSVVASNVDSLLDEVAVIAYPYMVGVAADRWVVGHIERFDADRQGNVQLSVQWGILDKERKNLVIPRRSRYDARATPGADAEAMVQAMNTVLAQFSRDIANEVKTTMR
jgi:uncharacterized lipoprotein YmbA